MDIAPDTTHREFRIGEEYSAQRLIEEVTAAEDLNRNYWSVLDDIRARYMGDRYRGAYFNGATPVLNTHEADFVASFLPQTVHDVPAVLGTSAMGGEVEDTSRILALTVTDHMKRTDLGLELERLALDQCLGFGCGIVETVPAPAYAAFDKRGDSEVVRWPKFRRLSPSRFGTDFGGMAFHDAWFGFHKTYIKRSKLLERARSKPEEGWNIDAINALPPATPQSWGERTASLPDRDEVMYYSMWCRDLQLDPDYGPEYGFNGTWFTFSNEVDPQSERDPRGRMLRRPHSAFCPPWGPYTMVGCYPVQDEVFPLSPLMTTAALARDVEDQMRAASQASRQYKKLVLVDATRQDLLIALAQPHNYVVPVSNIANGGFIEIEIGGMTAQQLQQIEYAMTMQDRSGGFDSQQRGITTDSTATAAAIANQRAGERRGYQTRKFTGGMLQIARTLAWYIFHDDRFMTTIAPAELQKVGVRRIEVRGGLKPGEPSLWDYMDLKLDDASYAYRAMETNMAMGERWLSALTALAPTIRTFPEYDWKRILNAMGDLYLRPSTSRMVDVNLSRAIATVQGTFRDPVEYDMGRPGPGSGGRSSSQRSASSVNVQRPAATAPGGARGSGQSGGGMGPGMRVQGQAAMGAPGGMR